MAFEVPEHLQTIIMTSVSVGMLHSGVIYVSTDTYIPDNSHYAFPAKSGKHVKVRTLKQLCKNNGANKYIQLSLKLHCYIGGQFMAIWAPAKSRNICKVSLIPA